MTGPSTYSCDTTRFAERASSTRRCRVVPALHVEQSSESDPQSKPRVGLENFHLRRHFTRVSGIRKDRTFPKVSQTIMAEGERPPANWADEWSPHANRLPERLFGWHLATLPDAKKIARWRRLCIYATGIELGFAISGLPLGLARRGGIGIVSAVINLLLSVLSLVGLRSSIYVRPYGLALHAAVVLGVTVVFIMVCGFGLLGKGGGVSPGRKNGGCGKEDHW